jgi:hypothetical protein
MTDTAIPKAQEQKSFTRTVAGAAGETMRLVAERWKGGGVSFAVRSTAVPGSKKGKSERGATTQHATFDAARAAVEKMLAQALKLGWRQRENPGFRRAAPDAFATLPAPSAPAKPKK